MWGGVLLNIYTKYLTGVYVLIILILPMLAFGHADGLSYEVEQDGYFIDIGYTADSYEVGETVRFDFSLQSLDESPEEFDVAWVRIVQDETLLFAGPIARAPVGPTIMSHGLLVAGQYQVEVRFQQVNNTLTTANFVFVVSEAESDADLTSTDVLVVILCAVLLVLLIGVLYLKRK